MKKSEIYDAIREVASDAVKIANANGDVPLPLETLRNAATDRANEARKSERVGMDILYSASRDTERLSKVQKLHGEEPPTLAVVLDRMGRGFLNRDSARAIDMGFAAQWLNSLSEQVAKLERDLAEMTERHDKVRQNLEVALQESKQRKDQLELALFERNCAQRGEADAIKELREWREGRKSFIPQSTQNVIDAAVAAVETMRTKLVPIDLNLMIAVRHYNQRAGYYTTVVPDAQPYKRKAIHENSLAGREELVALGFPKTAALAEAAVDNREERHHPGHMNDAARKYYYGG